MKLKRFIAPDMRQALRLVREEQGPDAVILSNQRVAAGIEIIAAVDYDPVLARHMLGNVAAAPAAGASPSERGAPESGREAAPEPAFTPAPVREESPMAAYAAVREGSLSAPAGAATAAADAGGGALAVLQREVAELRQVLECQLATMPWRDPSERDPFATSVLRGLAQLGLDPDLAMSLAVEMGPRSDLKSALYDLTTRLEARLPMVKEEVIDEGGVVALVGPTGVGKTTTVAKLAARFALRHGKRRLALVSLDNFRIGAHEQLLTFGRILGVPVHFTGDAEGLRRYLDQLGDKALVLVDTAGTSQRDPRLLEQLAPLAALGEDVRVLLTLAANTQRQALEDVVARFAPLQPSALVLTKLDESVSLGPALSVLMQRRMPLAYATDGQRVPEDIHFARSKRLGLAARAIALVRAAAGTVAAPAPADEVLSCA